MKQFMTESWNEYLELLKKIVPQNVQNKFKKNKTRYIKVLLIIIVIEIILFFTYTVFVDNSEVINKVDINKTEEVTNGYK